MPNYCRNEVTFECSAWDLEQVLDFVKESIPAYQKRVERWLKADPLNKYKKPPKRSILDFNNIIPYPEKYQVKDDEMADLGWEEFEKKYPGGKDGFNSGGYEWCSTNWGTKWGAIDDIFFITQKKTLVFDTAWAPSLPVMAALHKRFPTISMYYEFYDGGMGYIGGGEFLRESEFYPEDATTIEATTYKERNALVGTEDLKWAAGTFYNPWTSVYMGQKGG